MSVLCCFCAMLLLLLASLGGGGGVLGAVDGHVLILDLCSSS